MKISLIIPTRGEEKTISNMISCFQKQSFQDFEVIFVLDSFKTIEELRNGGIEGGMSNIKFITNQNSEFSHGKGVSYVRNFGIEKAKGEFINLMDDDEDFDGDYLQKSLNLREKYFAQIGKKFVLAPTIFYQNSGKIQSQGFDKFNRRIGRPSPYKIPKNKEIGFIKMFSCNSLFGPSEIFKNIKFDEQIDFESEDLDLTYRIHLAGFPIVVSKKLTIKHMEKDKTRLEKLRIGSPEQAYKKAKHRIKFVQKNGKTYEKIIFYLFGLWIFILASIRRVLFFGKNASKIDLLKNFFRGLLSK